MPDEESKTEPVIRPPTLEEKLRAAQDRLKNDPAIKKLMDDGKKVYIDTDTGEVKIIPDEEG